MEVNLLTLAFKNKESAMEEKFRKHFFTEKLWHFRFCCYMAIVFLATWVLIDYLFYQAEFVYFVGIKVVLSLFFGMGIVFSYKTSFRPFEQTIAFFYVIAVGTSFCSMFAITTSRFIYPLFFGVIITYIFNYTFIRLRFIYATIAGVLLLIFFSIEVIFFLGEFPSSSIIAFIYCLFILNILGMIISYSIEYLIRREFYLLEALNKEKEKKISAIEDKLYHDELTGLFNRHALEDFLEKRISYCKREKIPETLCFIDLDQLKYVNDKYGHYMGDVYISKLAEVINNNIRNNDMSFRIGGDEFIILFDNCSKDIGERIVKRIRSSYGKKIKEIFTNFNGSFSFGIIDIMDHIDKSHSELISIADGLMLINKKERKIERGEIKEIITNFKGQTS